MQKRDFETYQKHFRGFEILPKFSETHVFEVPFATLIRQVETLSEFKIKLRRHFKQ